MDFKIAVLAGDGIGPEISVVVLTQPGCDTNSDLFQMDGIVVVRHPYSTWDFKAAIAEVTRSLPEIEEGEDEDITGCLEEDDYAFCERARKYDLLLVPGTDFGCPGYFRAAYCIKTETIEKSLPLFKKLAAEYK